MKPNLSIKFCFESALFLDSLITLITSSNIDIHLIPDKEIEASVLEIFDILHTELMKVRADPSVVDPTITITLDKEGKPI